MQPDSPQSRWRKRLAADLAQRQTDHLLRRLRRVEGPQGATLCIDGTEYVQFCTNNYLALAADPEVTHAARTALDRLGTGAGASRLVAGSMELHHELESALARFKHADAALIFPSGLTANLGVLTTFAGDRDQIVSDKLNHASLLDAARFSGAAHRTFPHRHYARAADLLQRHAAGQPFLVTDTVFSMDGDIADLPAACAAAEAAGALVILDEAHATGVLGDAGRGLAELQNVEGRIALSVGTLSKALGSIGGFVAGPREAIDTLINAARPFIYTTALPPACSAASLAALQIVASDEGRRRRERVMALSRQVKQELTAMGYDCGDSVTPIIPVILGSSEAALTAAAFLQEKGLFVPAIRPPTVPPNTARLRISLMSSHTDTHVEALLAAMRHLRQRGCVTADEHG